MPAYLDLDDSEDIVIHLHDIARLVQRQVDEETGAVIKALAEKMLVKIREDAKCTLMD